MTASRSIYLYICGCVCIKICACMWGVLVVVLWFTYLLRECVYVCTAYGCVCRGASCVKLYVAGHLAVLHCAVGSSIVNYCSSHPRYPVCNLHSPTVTMLCVLCLCRSCRLWPRPTSAVQWRCCHVKDFTLATPHFCDSWGQGLYFVLTTDSPSCMCGEWATWTRAATDGCHMQQWLYIWSTLLRMSGGLLRAGKVQGSPKCTVNCVVCLVDCCCSNFMNIVTGMPFEISYIQMKINFVV